MPNIKYALFVILVTVVLAACSGKDNTDLVRESIQEGVKHAEAHAIEDLLKLATDDFIALPGRYNRRSIKRVLFAAFKHYGQFQIHHPRPSVKIEKDGQQAHVIIYFLIVSQSRELPGLKTLYDDPRRWVEAAAEKADLYQLKLEWIEQDGGWLVRRATLEGFKGTGF